MKLKLTIITLVLLITSCQLMTNKFTFINKSSANISISPEANSGQTWEEFKLEPNETYTLDLSIKTIKYSYTSSNSVTLQHAQTGDERFITFYDVK